MCPYYMACGMTYSEFWDGDPNMARAYSEAYRIRTERRNEEMWLQGRYIYDALCEASGLFRVSFSKRPLRAEPYTKEPYAITKMMQEEREERNRKAQLERMKMQFMEFASRVKPRTQSATEHRSVDITEENSDGIGDRQPTNSDSLGVDERSASDRQVERFAEETVGRKES